MSNIKKRVSLVFTYESPVAVREVESLLGYKPERLFSTILDIEKFPKCNVVIESAKVEEVIPPCPHDLFKQKYMEWRDSADWFDLDFNDEPDRLIEMIKECYGTK